MRVDLVIPAEVPEGTDPDFVAFEYTAVTRPALERGGTLFGGSWAFGPAEVREDGR